MFTRLSCASAALVLFGTVLAAQDATPPAADIARSVQRRYDGVRDFSAQFVHTYEGGVLRKKISERGTVTIKKPGRMRWEYTSPERKLFVSDSRTLYSYVPADRQVIVAPVETAGRPTTAAAFLAGSGDLTRDFQASRTTIEGAPADTYGLKLVPKQSEQEYEWLGLSVDRLTYQIRGLLAVDHQGGRSLFAFTNLKENAGVADKYFAFTPPPGTDVVTNNDAR
jgi:outer membrane lipoprotein carrier protein